jgi:lysozyme
MKKKRKLWLWIVSSAIVISFILVCGYSYLPLSKKQIKRSTAKIECRYCFVLTENGKDIAFFNDIDTDSLFTDLAYREESAIRTVTYTAYWINKFKLLPWCHGRLLTRFSTKSQDRVIALTNKHLPYIIDKEKARLKQKRHALKSEIAELKYYLSRHNVQDEGFTTISIYDTKIKADYDTIRTLSSIIDAIDNPAKVKVKYVPRYTVVYKDISSHVKRQPCAPLVNESRGNDHVILQTANHRIPIGVRVLSMHQFGIYGEKNVGKGVYWIHKEKKPVNGHGTFVSSDGDYYEGRWTDGKRNGFGFSVAPYRNVRAGEWKNDVYLGERMIYTSERIYGIDISRYQHATKVTTYYRDKHRRKRKRVKMAVSPIQWDKLRITNLGNISKKRVSGTVDYPVSFVYIKSTEGKNLRSPYYGHDYITARRYGFRVGTYHFFSTTSSVETQAKFFLRHSMLRPGDLPPALDVEPSEKQIKKMGGKDVLLKRVVEWLKIVENHTGVRPLLYVNQQFVNRYLNDATYIKSNYQIWIARYGEYKPDVKLVYWQLCPDGKVNGIKGDVDINVFNGYRGQFNDFIANGGVK